MEPECKRRKLDSTGRRLMKSYKRYDKPPYSYVGMTALVIRAAPDHQLCLSGILTTLREMFPFFQGEYQGWKDSVRHNLSHNHCFYKVPQIINNVARTKRCEWGVDLTKLPVDAMTRQDSKKTKDNYAPILTDNFGLPSLAMVPPGIKLTNNFQEINTLQKQKISEVFKLPKLRPLAPKLSTSFSIDSILDSKDRVSCSTTDVFISHAQLPSYPRTMFDNQTPERALENLRHLCNVLNSDADLTINNPNGVLCNVSNVTSIKENIFSTPIRELQFSACTPLNIKTEVRYDCTPVSSISAHGSPAASTPSLNQSILDPELASPRLTSTPYGTSINSSNIPLFVPTPINHSSDTISCSPFTIDFSSPSTLLSSNILSSYSLADHAAYTTSPSSRVDLSDSKGLFSSFPNLSHVSSHSPSNASQGFHNYSQTSSTFTSNPPSSISVPGTSLRRISNRIPVPTSHASFFSHYNPEESVMDIYHSVDGSMVSINGSCGTDSRSSLDPALGYSRCHSIIPTIPVSCHDTSLNNFQQGTNCLDQSILDSSVKVENISHSDYFGFNDVIHPLDSQIFKC